MPGSRSAARSAGQRAAGAAGPLSARIHAWLRDAILAVRLPPGAAIAEPEIAARFDASRTPVREALLRLADEGLVDVRPQRGTYVAGLDATRIDEALFVREAVECAVLRRVARRADRAEIALELLAAIRDHARANTAGDTAAALAADTRFHLTLVEAAGLPGVWDTVARARDMHQRLRAIAVPELKSGAQAVREHRAIVAALAAGDAAAAEAAMSVHIERNRALLARIAQRHPDYFTRPPSY